MGFQKVNTVDNKNEMQHFVRSLLDDVQAFEYMLEHDWFESDIVRIGAEQEMCLVHNKTFKPATINMEVLEHLKDMPWCVTELAKFNLETNLSPREFTGDCLSQLEAENHEYLSSIHKVRYGIVDGSGSSDGRFGVFADPGPNETRTVIGGADLVAVDWVGATRMGIDPMISTYMQLAVEAFGKPAITLVGDANGCNVGNLYFAVGQNGLCHFQLGLPDFVGIVLYPTGFGVVLGEFLLFYGNNI